MALNDGTSMPHLQVVADREMISGLSVGCSVRVDGNVVPCLQAGSSQSHELKASGVTLLGACPPGNAYPLAKKWHSPEYLRGEAVHLRPRSNVFGAVLRVRNAASASLHDYLQVRRA